eukprot:gene7431-10127_t
MYSYPLQLNKNRNLKLLQTSPSEELANDDFDKMKAEIEAILQSSSRNNFETLNENQTDKKSWFLDNLNNGKLQKKTIAVISSIVGCLLFSFQHSQPVSGVTLLKAMERDSVPVEAALCNGKPTLIEFYADWCESCKATAPSMRALELKFRKDINFLTIDGVNKRNSALVDKFRVDGIPHLAFIDRNTEVKTALVGAVPSKIVNEDLLALLKDQPLPYEGYDAFEGESHFPFNNEAKICKVEIATD